MFTAFLIAVGVSCGITSLLALLMVVADEIIANYGDLTVQVNDGKEFVVRGGRPLLSTLKDEQVFIPSACGGRGSCGLCKLEIIEGAGAPLPTELPWLSPEEMRDGTRLSCQIKVKSDLRIRIPEELLDVRQYMTEVVSMRDLTYDIKEVRLRLVDPPEMDFVGGQFIQFEVPEYELTDEPVYRAYSVSSDPAEKHEIELEIRLVPDGICTTYVHRHLKVGDRVTVNGPYGDFRLSDTGKPMVCIAGGSGMAPIKAMLLRMDRTGDTRKITYFFGARAERDLFLVDRMRQLERSMHDFAFIPALSEPEEGDDWPGETGLITEVVGRRIEDASTMEAYLCGSPLMVDACIEVLAEKGMPEKSIFYDKFA